MVFTWHCFKEMKQLNTQNSVNNIQKEEAPEEIDKKLTLKKSKKNVNKISNNNNTLKGFKQLGVLFNEKRDIILPLFGKTTLPATIYHLPYVYGENSWNYYSMSDGNMVPITYEKEDCMNHVGCKELQDNDIIYISVFNDHFRVKMYEIELLQNV
jgi:hypothetical protein